MYDSIRRPDRRALCPGSCTCGRFDREVPASSSPRSPVHPGGRTPGPVPRGPTQPEDVDDEDRIVAVFYDLDSGGVLVTAAHVAGLRDWPAPREASCPGDLLATAREETTSVIWSGAGIGALFGAARLKSVEGESRSAPARPRVTPRLPRLLEALKGPASGKYVGRRPWFSALTSENTVSASRSYAGYSEELCSSAHAQGGTTGPTASHARPEQD